jgi:hypothetical protein
MTVTERYIELGLRLGRHVDGLVDAYYGPAELQQQVEAEPLRDPAGLVGDAEAILGETDDRWLAAQVVGLQTVARKLAGEEIPYLEEVERCYGVRPELAPDSLFEEAHAKLDEVLPAGGSLEERYQAWRERNPLPRDLLEPALKTISQDLRERTRDLYGLPEGEEAELDFVTDEPWSAYNYYLGGLRSRVSVNVDVPMVPSFITELMAHELYPGHHTEHAWKEQLHVRDAGRWDESILMIGAPQSLIAEGIARLASEMLVEDEDELTAMHLAPLGIEYDAESAARIRRAKEPLDFIVGTNAALLLHDQGQPQEEVRAYLQRWRLMSDPLVDQAMRFITDPMWRAYVPTYSEGYRVCGDWVAGDRARFKRLLTEQLTPEDLVDGVSSGR